MVKKLFLGAFNVHRISALTCVSKSILLMLALFVSSQSYGAPNPFLSTSGQNIRNNYGQGDIVPLRGVNLGSWLLMEGWMCPVDSSGLADNYTVIQTLNNRFGVATQESLLKTYQDAWITTNDLDNIKALGMNCMRMPFWWGNVRRLDGTWRADAFEKMDWLVTNAWKRGIYTIIDFHGVPGGQSTSDSTAQANQNQYWTSAAFQNQTSLIWSNVAAHFNGNPAVAGYDLINEPFGAPTQAALWSAYTNLYQTIRAVDPDHIIVIEGCWSGQGLNWEWNVLPPPTRYNWTNVVYSMHAYAGDTSSSGEKAETDKQASDFNSHQAWNIPCFIGEFNSHGTHSAWQYSILQYDQNNMSWANWAYKAIAGSVGNSWGIYDPTGTWPPKPNIQSDSISTISNDWSQWKTSTAFGVTSFLKQYLGAPLAIADFYTNSGTLIVNSNSGVLANDQDINLGLSGISLSAVLVGNPANGQLTLNKNGSFTYTPNGGFNGIDTFRYRVFDGYVNSANIATVSIQVYPPVSQTNAVLNMTDNKNGTFTLNFLGTVGVMYCVQTATNLTPPVYWLALAGSTNTVTNSSGLWSCTSTNSGSQRYYRSVVAYP
jgi:endoglucanase